MKVTVECSRCHKIIEGLIEDGFTAGFYDTKSSSSWGKFADKNEEVICDDCMHNDYRYKSVYNGEFLINIDKFIQEFVDLGCSVDFWIEQGIWIVKAIEQSKHGQHSEKWAEGIGATKESAVNDAYLWYLKYKN